MNMFRKSGPSIVFGIATLIVSIGVTIAAIIPFAKKDMEDSLLRSPGTFRLSAIRPSSNSVLVYEFTWEDAKGTYRCQWSLLKWGPQDMEL